MQGQEINAVVESWQHDNDPGRIRIVPHDRHALIQRERGHPLHNAGSRICGELLSERAGMAITSGSWNSLGPIPG